MNKLLGLLLLVPTFAFGHGTLLETVPVADSTVTAPENIVLRFNQNVKLIKFVVASEEGEEVETWFKGPHQGVWPEFTIPTAPSRLGVGTYTVSYGFIGADGHTMTDSFNFKVREANAQDVKREADTFVDAIVL